MVSNTIERSNEYAMVSDFYDVRSANRSGVPLINHINEGLYVMGRRCADTTAMRAFCIHPLLQSNSDLKNNWYRVSVYTTAEVMLLAMEYRNIANQYLSHRVISDISEITLSPVESVNEMLVADKVQNYKDFIIYHKDTHPRSAELEKYFNNWLRRLQITDFVQWYEMLRESHS